MNKKECPHVAPPPPDWTKQESSSHLVTFPSAHWSRHWLLSMVFFTKKAPVSTLPPYGCPYACNFKTNLYQEQKFFQPSVNLNTAHFSLQWGGIPVINPLWGFHWVDTSNLIDSTLSNSTGVFVFFPIIILEGTQDCLVYHSFPFYRNYGRMDSINLFLEELWTRILLVGRFFFNFFSDLNACPTWNFLFNLWAFKKLTFLLCIGLLLIEFFKLLLPNIRGTCKKLMILLKISIKKMGFHLVWSSGSCRSYVGSTFLLF